MHHISFYSRTGHDRLSDSGVLIVQIGGTKDCKEIRAASWWTNGPEVVHDRSDNGANISLRRWRTLSTTRVLTISGRRSTSFSMIVPNERCVRSSKVHDRCSRRAICQTCVNGSSRDDCYVLNRTVNRQRDDGKTPFEAWFGFKSSVAHFTTILAATRIWRFRTAIAKSLTPSLVALLLSATVRRKRSLSSLIGRGVKCLFRVTWNLTKTMPITEEFYIEQEITGTNAMSNSYHHRLGKRRRVVRRAKKRKILRLLRIE